MTAEFLSLKKHKLSLKIRRISLKKMSICSMIDMVFFAMDLYAFELDKGE